MLCAPTNIGGTGGVTAHRGRPLVRRGGPVLFSSPFVGDAGTAPPFSSDPHPVGAAVSRPRAHAMRPYKRGGGGWRRHGAPIPPPYPAGRPRLTFFPFRGERRNGTGLLTAPHPAGAAISRPTGACYAPPQMPGWGLAAARHTGTAPLSGRAAPSYFLPLSWGTPERDRPSQLTRIPQGRLSAARPRAHAMRPYKRGAGAGGAQHTDAAPFHSAKYGAPRWETWCAA